ncbi:hypothetical protein [Sulfurospirillum multivorans]|uniref:Mobile element protein n=2 Tax=Sulfurospirillum multivorans TaxID=66821 RepID=A0AA86AKS3_SULMK|nr:hypothetical protein [Sulfurospirillum multivorans]AHJ11323.1 putative mobile element protein [Sulfurospirillum multivorans DSM 12446]QEH04827.1 putative mobile element protein [Sulfurospirillum multivorans]
MEHDNKIKKTVRLEPSIYEAVEGYRGATRDNFTGAFESLILKGLENVNTTQMISKVIKDELKNIRQDQQKNTDRIISVLMGITRFIGRIYAHTFLTVEEVKHKNKEEIKEFEKFGITKSIEELRSKEEVKDNE